jgi:hypothetical protein
MTSMRGLASLGLFLCAGIFADACGRTGLDLGGPEDVPVTTGAAGHAAATGAAGAALEGAAGATAGIGEPGAPGTAGAAGTIATTGTAGATMTGAAGAPAMTGVAGAPAMPPPMRIPCGAETCTFGTQTCCARLQNGAPMATCIAATDSCQGGLSFSCSSTAECGGGAVCCVSTRSLSTTCEQPVACVLSPGIILCDSDADCPGLIGNCCGRGNMKFCARACNGGRGMGGGRPGGG